MNLLYTVDKNENITAAYKTIEDAEAGTNPIDITDIVNIEDVLKDTTQELQKNTLSVSMVEISMEEFKKKYPDVNGDIK